MVFLLHHWDSAGRTGDIFSLRPDRDPHGSSYRRSSSITPQSRPISHYEPNIWSRVPDHSASIKKTPAEAEGPVHFSSLLLAVCSAATVTKMSDVDGTRTGC